MLQEISKKLTMKKSFFTTQLEGFFNSISNEYQEFIHKLEVQNSLLQEKIAELEKDIKNLVEIKNRYEKESEIDKRRIRELQESLAKGKNLSSTAFTETLQKENEKLKRELEELRSSSVDKNEVKELKDKLSKLQNYISKGASVYNETITSQRSEELLKEISEALKKE
jgi:CHASE3 domain sensor protein